MSISVFSQSRTKDMSVLKAFLDENKAGTFLEDATLELSTTAVENDTLTITLGDSQLKLAATASGNYNDIEYTGSNMTVSFKGNDGYGGSYPYISKLMFCKNGIVFEYMRRNTGDSAYGTEHIIYPVAVTVDSAGNLAMIYWGINGLSVANAYTSNIYYAVTYSSISVSAVTVIPQNSAQFTSLAPIVANTSDNAVSLPYAYAAVHQQVAGLGLTKVVMDGTYYITNGLWYIKDE